MFTFIVLNAISIVALPTLWIVGRRSKFMLEKHTGMQTEVRSEAFSRMIKASMPSWLLMVLVEADQLIHMLSVSRDFRLFWLGFFSASWLFITALMIVAYAPLARQMREKQRQRLQRKDGV